MSTLPAHVLEIIAAKRRAVSMGVPHPPCAGHEASPIAACVSNYTTCIEVEDGEPEPDFLAMLGWVLIMARRINAHCDAHRVAGDRATEYWLAMFALHCDCVCDWEVLAGAKPPPRRSGVPV